MAFPIVVRKEHSMCQVALMFILICLLSQRWHGEMPLPTRLALSGVSSPAMVNPKKWMPMRTWICLLPMVRLIAVISLPAGFPHWLLVKSPTSSPMNSSSKAPLLWPLSMAIAFFLLLRKTSLAASILVSAMPTCSVRSPATSILTKIAMNPHRLKWRTSITSTKSPLLPCVLKASSSMHRVPLRPSMTSWVWMQKWRSPLSSSMRKANWPTRSLPKCLSPSRISLTTVRVLLLLHLTHSLQPSRWARRKSTTLALSSTCPSSSTIPLL